MAWDTVSGSVPLLLTDSTNQYVYGPDDTPLTQITGTTANWLHQDQLASTRLITGSTGTVVGTNT